MAQLIFITVFLNLVFGLIFYRRLRRTEYIYFVQFIPLAIAAAQAGAQYYRAKKQKQAAKKALAYRNPALDAATNIAKSESIATRYPGQDIEEANVRQGIADASGNIGRATKSSADVVNASSRLQGQQQKAYQSIAQTGQSFRQNAMDKYRQMLLKQAGVQDENRQYSETLLGASAQNRYNALQSGLGGVAATNFGQGYGGNSNWQYKQPGNFNLGNGQMSGWNFNPNTFSAYKWNPNAFSAGGSFR